MSTEGLLRLAFPKLRTVSLGHNGASMGKPVKAIRDIAHFGNNQSGAYMTVCDFDSIRGSKRANLEDYPNPQGYFLVLDFDLKHQTQYLTYDELLVVLRDIFEPSCTAIVYSGGGYHVYYCSTEVLRSTAVDHVAGWHQSMRESFTQSCITLDKRAGRALTDVIRVPGSHHPTHGVAGEVVYLAAQASTPQEIVEGLRQVQSAVTRYPGANPYLEDPTDVSLAEADKRGVLWKQAPKSARPTTTPILMAKPTMAWDPLPVADLRKHCKAFDEFLTASERDFEAGTRGNREDVLMFYSLAQFIDVGLESPREYSMRIIGRWPNSDASWREKEYDNLVPRYTPAPWSCDKWSEYYNDVCAQCPYKSPSMNPIKAAREGHRREVAFTEQEYSPEDVQRYLDIANAEPFFVSKVGELWHKQAGKQGADDKYTMVMKPAVGIKYARRDGEGLLRGLQICNLSGSESMIPAEGINDNRKRGAAMSSLNVWLAHAPRAGEFIQKMASEAPSRLEFDQFGWDDLEQGHERFVGPGYTVTPDGSVECLMAEGALNAVSRRSIELRGRVQDWCRAVSAYRDPVFLPYQFAILSSFASVLYAPVVNSPGPVLTLVGKRNAGKSTCLFAANSVWFPPTMTTIASIDTELGIYGAFQALRNLPVTLNELSHIDEQLLHRMIFAVTEGHGRRGMSHEQTLKKRQTWCTMMLMSSNKPTMELIANEAAGNLAVAARLLDVASPPPQQPMANQLDRMSKTLAINFGVAGRTMVEGMLRTGIQRLIDSYQHYLAGYRVQFPEIDRFVLKHCALTMVVADWLSANNMASFFDRDTISVYLDSYIKNQHAAAERATLDGLTTPADVLMPYLGNTCPTTQHLAKDFLGSLPLHDAGRYRDSTEIVWEDNQYYYFSRQLAQKYLRIHEPGMRLSMVIDAWVNNRWVLLHGKNKQRTTNLMMPVYTAKGSGVDMYEVKVIVVPKAVIDRISKLNTGTPHGGSTQEEQSTG